MSSEKPEAEEPVAPSEQKGPKGKQGGKHKGNRQNGRSQGGRNRRQRGRGRGRGRGRHKYNKGRGQQQPPQQQPVYYTQYTVPIISGVPPMRAAHPMQGLLGNMQAINIGQPQTLAQLTPQQAAVLQQQQIQQAQQQQNGQQDAQNPTSDSSSNANAQAQEIQQGNGQGQQQGQLQVVSSLKEGAAGQQDPDGSQSQPASGQEQPHAQQGIIQQQQQQQGIQQQPFQQLPQGTVMMPLYPGGPPQLVYASPYQQPYYHQAQGYAMYAPNAGIPVQYGGVVYPNQFRRQQQLQMGQLSQVQLAAGSTAAAQQQMRLNGGRLQGGTSPYTNSSTPQSRSRSSSQSNAQNNNLVPSGGSAPFGNLSPGKWEASHPPFFSIDIECVAHGNTHNDRIVAQVALVDQYENVLLNLYIKPDKPVVSYLYKLTGLTEEKLSTGISFEQAKEAVRQALPKNAMIVGQNVLKDIQWLEMLEGKDFGEMRDLAGLWRVFNDQYKNFSYFSLHHEAKHLLHVEQKEPHDASTDAIMSVRLYRLWQDLQENPSEYKRAQELLLATPPEPSFAKLNPTYDDVCMGNRSTCKCGAPWFG